MKFDRTKPYNSLPPLPPKADIESKAILKKCISARAALAELKQAGELIPDQSVLINTIPLLEAQLSSEIENIVTTTDKLFRYASSDTEKADPATKEALSYRQALYQGYLHIKQKPVCTSTAVDVCRTILNKDIGIRKIPGTALKNPATNQIVYTPPVSEDIIRRKLANWEKFLNQRQDLDPLIRLAITHYQFEAIHPFTDGNGRTGRLLNVLFLIQEGLLDIPVLYLSHYIINHKNDYYLRLRAVTEKQQWEKWITYILDGVEKTSSWTKDKIKTINKLLTHTCDYVRQEEAKIYSRELVDIIFEQPYCRIANLVETGIAKRQTASVYLKQLVKIGVLDEVKAGREKLYLHPKFLKLLTEDKNSFEPYPIPKTKTVKKVNTK
ncbi:protein adenylyltransferase Fic [Planctomycetota bacterium]